MSWLDDHYIYKKNDTRELEGFLFLPKTIKCKTKWLKKAKWGEKYVVHLYVLDSYWKATHWIN